MGRAALVLPVSNFSQKPADQLVISGGLKFLPVADCPPLSCGSGTEMGQWPDPGQIRSPPGWSGGRSWLGGSWLVEWKMEMP